MPPPPAKPVIVNTAAAKVAPTATTRERLPMISSSRSWQPIYYPPLGLPPPAELKSVNHERNNLSNPRACRTPNMTMTSQNNQDPQPPPTTAHNPRPSPSGDVMPQGVGVGVLRRRTYSVTSFPATPSSSQGPRTKFLVLLLLGVTEPKGRGAAKTRRHWQAETV